MSEKCSAPGPLPDSKCELHQGHDGAHASGIPGTHLGGLSWRHWSEIAPKDATEINAATDPTITAPVNEMGEPCPWPWEPQQLVGVPLGQYHCPWCGAMVIAGVPHIDYGEVL